MEKKNIIRTLKPVNWIKGLLMLIIGIMNSRLEVGLGRFIASLIFGSWVYFFLLISGFSLILFIKIWSFNSQNNSGIKLVKFFLIIFYIIAYLICILHTILQNLSIIVPIVLALIGALWVLILYYGKDWDKKCIITQCVISLMVSFGIIYGGLINILSLPISIYLFFIAVFTLQFSKDIIKSTKYFQNPNREENAKYEFAIYFGAKQTKWISLSLNFIVIIAMLIPILTPLYNSFLYFFPTIIIVVLLAITNLLIFKTDLERAYKKVISFLLRTSIFLQFLALILASF